MIRSGAIISLLLTLLVSGVASVHAQEAQSPFTGKKIIGFQPTSEDKVALARRLIALQRFQEAADLLESQYEAQPDNDVVVNLLRTCYDQLKQYEKAELLVRRVVEKQPRNYGQMLYLAELLVRMNREQEALAGYDQAAAILDEVGQGGAMMLIRSLINSQLDSAAQVRIDSARSRYGDKTLFALERGSILEKHQQYREAVREYLPLLVRDSAVDSDHGEQRLLALLNFEASSAEVEGLLKTVADSTSSVRVMRLLTDHYLKAGRFDEAFSYSLRQDSLEGRNGVALITYAHQCQERRLWPQVVRATEIILQQHPDGRFFAETSFARARALAELGRAEEAAQVYTNLAQQAPDVKTQGDAIYGLGVLYSEYLHDYDRALVYYDSVINYFPRGQGYLMARKAAPLCHLRKGRLTQAREQLTSLGQSRLPDDLREEIAFLSGLVEFYDRRYDTAQSIFRKLTVDYSEGFYVNDALRFVMAITEAKGVGSALDDYSGALYARYRGEVDSARTLLIAVADGKPPALGDIGLYELIGLELKQPDSAAALEAIDRLDKEHPESYYRPLGLKLKADILIGSGRDLKQGLELYRILLENYSEYPFTREVRDKLRELESRAPVG